MKKRRDFDSAWKKAITLFFRPFLEFFFEDIARDVDWSHPVTFLESELRKAYPNDKIGRRQVDVLASVHRLDGSERWVLIHIEMQSQWDAHFEERMWVSHSRIRQTHRAPSAAWPSWETKSGIGNPTAFRKNCGGASRSCVFAA